MPLYEYECDKCGRTIVDVRPIGHRDWPTTCIAKIGPLNYTCWGTFHRKAAAPAFTIKGFNARNGYSDNS